MESSTRTAEMLSELPSGFSFRAQGIFYEALTNRILDELVAACRPRRLTVRGDFRVRGGISSVVTVTWPSEASPSPGAKGATS